jgi:hypothetical protein
MAKLQNGAQIHFYCVPFSSGQQGAACSLLHAGFLLGLFFAPED